MQRVLPLLLLAACEACATEPPTRVLLHIAYDHTIDSTTEDFVWHGADAWADLGIQAATGADNLPPCAAKWWNSPEICEITLLTEFWPQASMPHSSSGVVVGFAEKNDRTIVLSLDLHDFSLENAIAHEVGHSVWWCDAHLLPGETGIMAAVSTGDVVPTDADLRYVTRCTDGAL